MRQLSRHVKRAMIGGDEVLFHLVTRDTLPLDADEAKLSSLLFYDDQNKDAIKKFLLREPSVLQLYLIPTWGCTLRCPYCYVLHQLKGNGMSKSEAPDIDKVIDFVRRYLDVNKVSVISITYLGGEPLTNQKFCRDSFDAIKAEGDARGINVRATVTTNGTNMLDEDGIAFIRGLSELTVSVDGVKSIHDMYRRPAKDSPKDSPYVRTMRFIKQCINEAGAVDKLSVQGSFSNEMFADADLRKLYVAALLSVGVKRSMIGMYYVNPTATYDRSTIFYEAKPKNQKFRAVPCCCFRYFSFFLLDRDGIHGNYFAKDSTFLGTYEDSIETLRERSGQHVMGTMPALKDEKCMSCDVFGACWGGCYGHSKDPQKPSEHCGQESLRRKVDMLCRDGGIIKHKNRYELYHGVENGIEQ